MSVRVQVILDEEDAARFKSEAGKESKSLSAWLRDAGRKMLKLNEKKQTLTERTALKDFFRNSNREESGDEPDWVEHKKLIEEGFSGSHKP